MEEDKTLKNIMNDDFGKIILKIRKEKNLTQKELADLINVSDRTISKWENGQSVPDLICIKNICKSLGISPSSLVLDKKSKKEHITDVHQKLKKFLNLKCIIHLTFIILFILLCLFYFNNRNTITIYKLKLSSEDIYINTGYYIRTKYKNILVIDDIRLNHVDNYDDITIKLFTIVNGDELVIYERNSLENIYIDNLDGYYPKLTDDIFNSITKDLHISITLKQNDVSILYEGTFSIIKKYQNNKIVNNTLDDENNTIAKYDSLLSNNKLNEKLLSLGFEYKNGSYINKPTNDVLEIVSNKGIINLKKNNKTVVNYYYEKRYLSFFDNVNHDNSIHFIHYTDDRIDECVKGKCKNHYDEIDELLSIYKEIKDIL